MKDGVVQADGDPWSPTATWLSDCTLLYVGVPYAVRVALVQALRPPGIVDVVAGGEDVAIYLADPHTKRETAERFVVDIAMNSADRESCRQVKQGASCDPAGIRSHQFVVSYGGPGTDLEEVSVRLGLPVDEVVRLHVSPTYQVQSTGFSPGFAYVGTLPQRLRLARKQRPRLDVQPGAVAIAAAYTGIYPRLGAGGWWILGYVSSAQASTLWAWDRQPPARLQLGDKVRFGSCNVGLESGGEV